MPESNERAPSSGHAASSSQEAAAELAERRRRYQERVDALFDFIPDGPDPDDDSDEDEDWDDDGEDSEGWDTDEDEDRDEDTEGGEGRALDEPAAARHDVGEVDVDDGSPRSGGMDATPVGRRRTVEGADGDRLQKVLARVGVGSRRACEELIDAGRVRVNGQIAALGRRVDPEKDLITVDGAPIGTAAGLVYYLLNKPEGVVTTASDEHGRETVVDLVPEHPRVYPVGRLDAETEGLLLLTNDGELAYRITHPSFGVEKEYLAEVRGRVSPGALRQLREGVALDDGLTAPARASMVGPSVVRLTIHEGRNRQVRRMLDAVGHPVVRLARTRVGPIADRDLPPGRWRPLDDHELEALRRAVRETRAMRRAGTWRAQPPSH